MSLTHKAGPILVKGANVGENSLFRNIPDATVQISASGRVIALNPAAETLTGWRTMDAYGKHWSDLFQFGPEEQCAATLMKPLLTGVSRSEFTTCHLKLVRPNKQITAWVSAGAVPHTVSSDGGMILIIRDITAADRAQRDFFRSRHLAGLQQFGGGLATQCTNLITAMQGSVESLSRSTTLSPREARDFQSLQRALESVTALTRQLLAFSKRLPLNLQVVDLNLAANSVLPLIQVSAGKHCQVELELDPALGRIEADFAHTEEILLALVRNARERMPEGGTIRIKTRNYEVTPEKALQFVDLAAGSYAMLEVADSGTALGAPDEDHLFEPFFSTRPPGKGLGLAGVYGLTKQSGGYIWHESSAREGTRFFLCWPCVDPGPEPEPAGSGLEGRETILVVDHDRNTRDLVQRALLNQGYHILESTSSTQALRTCRQWDGDIHLALVNVLTSSATGPEIAKRIASIRPKTQVLYMSSYAARVLHQAGAPEMGARFIQKPFTPEALARRIRLILDAQ